MRAGWICGFFLGMSAGALAASQSRDPQFSTPVAVMRDLCDRKIVLLGEATHGDGKTLAFKTQIVRRLIEECHFNAFFIESGIYDFLNIENAMAAGQSLSTSTLSAAIGGLWANEEMQPLLPYLVAKANRHELVLGGIDDQIGTGTWALRAMTTDLARYLSGSKKTECLDEFRQFAVWQSSGRERSGANRNSAVLGCLKSIESALSDKRNKNLSLRETHLQMTRSLRRFVSRDLSRALLPNADVVRMFNSRDESMFANFQWSMSRLPKEAKVIVWGASVHMAKDLRKREGPQKGKIPFGSFVRKEYKDRSFALGFTAYEGEYLALPNRIRTLSPAPEASLEELAFPSDFGEFFYFDSKHLPEFGTLNARPLGYLFMNTKWNEVLDGIVVFRVERPAVRLSAPTPPLN